MEIDLTLLHSNTVEEIDITNTYNIDKKYFENTDINKENIDKIIEDEIGIVFAKVLEHAGVFKNTGDFLKFTEAVK